MKETITTQLRAVQRASREIITLTDETINHLLLALAELSIPGHRGVMHSWSAAFLWGILVFAFLLLLNLSVDDSLLVGVFAALGYLLHLLIDFFGDRI